MAITAKRRMLNHMKNHTYAIGREGKAWWDALLLAAMFSIACLMRSAVVNPDPDAYFLSYTGGYILKNGFPAVNPACAVSGGIVIQQWVVCIWNYLLFSIGEVTGTWMWGAIVLAACTAMCWKYASVFTEKPWVKLTAVSFGFFAACVNLAVSRPSPITFMLLTEYLILLEKSRDKAWLYTPVFSFALANTHAAFWAFLYVLAMPCLVPQVETNNLPGGKGYLNKNKGILSGLIFAVPAGLLNPYGMKGMLYLFLSYGTASGLKIEELQRTGIFSYCGLLVAAAIIVLAVYCIRGKAHCCGGGKDFWKTASMSAGTIMLACMHLRNIWFLALGTIPVICQIAGAVESVTLGKEGVLQRAQGRYCAMAEAVQDHLSVWCFTIIIVFAAFFLQVCNGSASLRVADSKMAPVAAADYLDSINGNDVVRRDGAGSQREISILTTFNSGAYMEWRGYKILIDSRPELYGAAIFGENLLDEYEKALDNGDLFTIVEKYGFTHILTEGSSRAELWALRMEEEGLLEKNVDGNGYSLWAVIQPAKTNGRQ